VHFPWALGHHARCDEGEVSFLDRIHTGLREAFHPTQWRGGLIGCGSCLPLKPLRSPDISKLLGFSFDGVLARRAGEGLHAGGATKGDHAVVGFNPVDGSGGFVVDRADIVDGPSGDGCCGNGCAEEEGGEKRFHRLVWAGLQCASETGTHHEGSS
jgi:hypothetical protein